ncbi:hypothetical protein AS594_36085 [Streptomyces agglomeratus]|uniref:DUF2637 domain-containing protein n=1 Tax=Streptomyces agglomeratus TaxID=285458 RepID=A0A1E5PHI7_9ACTN|nr:DUF2637 domain-containing protein [Streptomyces agglomeratus]OEJ29030.1 hypothetical protein AS594_36085 [Streptomyces agglomeratus]
MNISPWALPAGLAVAGIGAAAVVALLVGNRRRAEEHNATAEERAQLAVQRRNAWQRRLAVIALGVGCLMMFVLAGIAAWLSFGAQREYAHAHNGGNWDQATGFALLLDAGALSLSLIRFFEALTLRSSALTRILLLGFVSASAAMNLLHAPGKGAGSAFLAVVPPLVYAILLEMLLFKVEQVIMGRQKRRKADQDRGYSLLLWLPWPIGAPVKMWKAWRTELLKTVDNVRVIGSQRPHPTEAVGEMTVERADTAAPTVTTAADTAPANALPAGSPLPTAEKAEEPTATTPAAAPQPVVAPQGSQEPAAKNEEAPVPPAVREPRPEPEPEPEPEAEAEAEADEGPGSTADPVEPIGKGAPLDPPGEDEPLPGDEDDEEPDPEHDTPPDDEGDQEARERLRIEIDLSVLPANLSQRQRAERIYIAHQAAGVALSHADLGKWAGYKNPNSGGNEYRRLEKTHGPILVREGATHVDLNWSHQEERADSGHAVAA